MNKIINSLPKLTKNQQDKKEEYCNSCSSKDNFTVKKCPYSEGFIGMDVSNLKNIGSSWDTKHKSKEPFIQLFNNGSSFSSIKKEEEPEQTIKNLPDIHGIDKNDDKDVKEEQDKVFFEPDTITKMYAGSLTVIGLFILFRVVKKTM